MGLFENKKILCPICSKPTPRVLSTKVEGIPICRECVNKIDLPVGMVNQMSLEDFRKYMVFYDQNQALRDIFTETYRMGFGFFGSYIVLDTANRLFRLQENTSSLVMEASDLKSFCILEDNVPLFEGEGNILRCHSSEVPTLINNMAPQIAQFCMQREMYEQIERMELDNKDGKSPKQDSSHYRFRPDFEASVPFKHFYVELTLTHPYWSGFRGKLDAPGFDRDNPSIHVYMREYQQKVDQLHTLAVNLMQLISPNAREICDTNISSAAAQSSSGRDTAGDRLLV